MRSLQHIASGQALPGIDPDADIIPRLAAGDDTALRILMDRHLGTIKSLASYMLKDSFAAEDVAQTVFIKTWDAASEWTPGQAKLITWMRRVATNQCLDMLKKHKPIYTDQVPERPDTTPLAQEALAAKEQSAFVKAGLQTLPDRQRAALTLSYYQGVSQKEGANILDITEAAYESLLVRARKALRLALEAHPERETHMEIMP